MSEDNLAYKSVDGNLFTKDGTTLIQYASGKTDTSYSFNEGITTIASDAFDGCKSLTNIFIPTTITEIGDYAFEGCSNLTIFTEYSSKPSGWSSSWNYSNRPVYWYSENEPAVNSTVTAYAGNYWRYNENNEIDIWDDEINLIKPALDQAAVDKFMSEYDYYVDLAPVNPVNKSEFEYIVDLYRSLTTDQLVLINDETIEDNIKLWEMTLAELNPVTETLTQYDWTSSDGEFTYRDGMYGVQLTSTERYSDGATFTFETVDSYASITEFSCYYASTGGGGVVFTLYIGDIQIDTGTASSSGFNSSRILTYSGPAISGKIKVVATVTTSSLRNVAISAGTISYISY